MWVKIFLLKRHQDDIEDEKRKLLRMIQQTFSYIQDLNKNLLMLQFQSRNKPLKANQHYTSNYIQK